MRVLIPDGFFMDSLCRLCAAIYFFIFFQPKERVGTGAFSPPHSVTNR